MVNSDKNSKGSYERKKNYKVKKEPYDKKRYDGAVKVREIKVVEKTMEDEYDEEEDKKLIVIIAVSILVIVGTIIGLLAGTGEENLFDEKDNQNEDIVDEDKHDDIIIDNEEENNDKTIAINSTKKKNNTSKDTYYNVYYYYFEDGNKVNYHYEKVYSGNYVKKYNPLGYYNCKYYTEDNNEFSFNKTISNDLELYLDCEYEEYNVNYEYNNDLVSENTNPSVYRADESIILEDINTEYKFLGWYLNYDMETNTYSNRVYVLDRSLYKYMDDNNLTLYGKVNNEVNVIYHNIDGETINKVVDSLDRYTFEGNIFEINDFLGWTTKEDGKNILTEVINISEEVINLYPVLGYATISYETENDNVVVGYTEEEINDEEFVLPTPTEIGLEPTYYVVLADEETENSKVVISDYDVEIDTDKQIYLSVATIEAVNGYVPSLGDNVLELENTFLGWNEVTTINDEKVISEEVITNEEVKEKVDSETDHEIELVASYEETDIVEG